MSDPTIQEWLDWVFGGGAEPNEAPDPVTPAIRWATIDWDKDRETVKAQTHDAFGPGATDA